MAMSSRNEGGGAPPNGPLKVQVANDSIDDLIEGLPDNAPKRRKVGDISIPITFDPPFIGEMESGPGGALAGGVGRNEPTIRTPNAVLRARRHRKRALIVAALGVLVAIGILAALWK